MKRRRPGKQKMHHNHDFAHNGSVKEGNINNVTALFHVMVIKVAKSKDLAHSKTSFGK